MPLPVVLVPVWMSMRGRRWGRVVPAVRVVAAVQTVRVLRVVAAVQTVRVELAVWAMAVVRVELAVWAVRAMAAVRVG